MATAMRGGTTRRARAGGAEAAAAAGAPRMGEADGAAVAAVALGMMTSGSGSNHGGTRQPSGPTRRRSGQGALSGTPARKIGKSLRLGGEVTKVAGVADAAEGADAAGQALVAEGGVEGDAVTSGCSKSIQTGSTENEK